MSRQHYQLLFRVFAVPTIIFHVSALGVRWDAGWLIKALNAHSTGEPVPVLVAVLVVCIALYFVGFVLVAVRQVAVVRMTVLAPVPYEEAFQYAIGRKWLCFVAQMFSTIFVLILFGFWLGLAALVLVASKAVLSTFVVSILLGAIGFCLTVSGSWLCLFAMLLTAVLACEGGEAGVVFDRAWALTRPSLARGGSFICVLITVIVLVTIAAELPLTFAGTVLQLIRVPGLTLFFQTLPPAVVTLAQALGHVWEAVISIVTMAVYTVTSGLYYWDVRQRRQGDDLLAVMRRLGERA